MQNIKLNQYEVFIFDCDGVILDSNKIKTNGFINTLKEFSLTPQQIDEAISYHKRHGGVPRDTKFFNIFEQCGLIEPQKHSDVAMRTVIHACSVYSKHVKELVCKCNQIPGIEEFLKKLPPQSYVYVVSGADQDELREALHVHRLAPYFQGIFGSGSGGKTKIEWLANIMEWTKRDLKTGLYFGDSILDYEAAKEFQMDFIFVSSATELDSWKSYCDTRNINNIKDFNEINAE